MPRFTPSQSKAEAEALVRTWVDAHLWHREARLAETGGFDFLEPHEVEKMGRQEAAELEALMHQTERMFAGEEKAKIARALGPSVPGDLPLSLPMR